MRCETCFGIGETLIDREGQPVNRLRDAAMMIPCPDCGGSGLAHCCEGDSACNQTEAPDGPPRET